MDRLRRCTLGQLSYEPFLFPPLTPFHACLLSQFSSQDRIRILALKESSPVYVAKTKFIRCINSKTPNHQPIPLEYLLLGPFNGPTDSRREERSEGGSLFQSIMKPTHPMFPLVIYHASSPARRYTLYASSEAARKKWKEVLSEALGVRKAVMDANRVSNCLPPA
jgi:hypothetical protein